MSYSFTVKAANKSEAKDGVAAELAKVVETQPVHAGDHDQALAAAHAYIDLMPDSASRDVTVEMYGSLSGSWEGDELIRVLNATVKIVVNLPVKPLPKDE